MAVIKDSPEVTQGGIVSPTLPVQRPPDDKEFSADMKVLLAQSDKELRIMYQGLYQAVQQSQPLYATTVVKSLDHWREIIEREVDYLMGRILDRARV